MVSSGDLQAPRKNPGALFKKMLRRTGSQSGYFLDNKTLLPLSGFETWIIQSVVLSQYRLLYPGSIINIIAIINAVVTICMFAPCINNIKNTLFIVPTDAHNYKIIGMLKQLKFRHLLRHVSVHAGTFIRELFSA